MTPVTVVEGNSPIVLAFPHSGTFVPPDIFGLLTPLGQTLADTDWHVDQLYTGLLPQATTVRANFHRYVIDANRDPAGSSLYPGQNGTGLVPMTDFDGDAIWSAVPEPEETAQRLAEWHKPYHEALTAQLDRVQRLHGIVLLFDCHSIRPNIPFLFDGQLPDFNIGTNSGESCDSEFQDAVVAICQSNEASSYVLNGRFKGGWTTRYYGKPAQNRHAIQMELSQSLYLENGTVPFNYDSGKAESPREILCNMLASLENIALSQPTRAGAQL